MRGHQGSALVTVTEAREVLGLAEDYSPDQVKHAYRLKVSHAHPDRPQGNAWWFRRLGEARDVLLAPETVQEGEPKRDDATSQEGTEDASAKLHPLVREALETLADDAATETLERIIGCRAGPAQAAVRSFLSVLRGPSSKGPKRKAKK